MVCLWPLSGVGGPPATAVTRAPASSRTPAPAARARGPIPTSPVPFRMTDFPRSRKGSVGRSPLSQHAELLVGGDRLHPGADGVAGHVLRVGLVPGPAQHRRLGLAGHHDYAVLVGEHQLARGEADAVDLHGYV